MLRLSVSKLSLLCTNGDANIYNEQYARLLKRFWLPGWIYWYMDDWYMDVFRVPNDKIEVLVCAAKRSSSSGTKLQGKITQNNQQSNNGLVTQLDLIQTLSVGC